MPIKEKSRITRMAQARAFAIHGLANNGRGENEDILDSLPAFGNVRALEPNPLPMPIFVRAMMNKYDRAYKRFLRRWNQDETNRHTLNRVEQTMENFSAYEAVADNVYRLAHNQFLKPIPEDVTIEPLGQGISGKAYKVTHTDGRIYVIKVLTNMNFQERNVFFAESIEAILRSEQSRHGLQLFAFNQEKHITVMEYIEGSSVADGLPRSQVAGRVEEIREICREYDRLGIRIDFNDLRNLIIDAKTGKIRVIDPWLPQVGMNPDNLYACNSALINQGILTKP